MPEKDQPNEMPEGKLPAAPTGNASNPSDREAPAVPEGENQLLGAGAEKYLRESASIEDMPDEQDWQEADRQLQQDNEEDAS